MKAFSKLFKKYRLKAEFGTLAELGNALAEKGLIYEESIFSHWQKGSRIPQNRFVLIKLLEIFVERNAISTLDEANELLESVKQGFLTKNELLQFPTIANKIDIFQVPSEISDFIGREDLIDQVKQEIKPGRVVHIYGSAGVGKTSLAIKIAHLLRSYFPDGVLWYRMSNVSLKELFISIGHLFSQKLPSSNNLEILASFIRSFLSQKMILLILDDVETKSKIDLLLPVSATVIILSRQKNIYIPADVIKLPLGSFSQKESLSLFENVLGKNYVNKYKSDLLRLSKSVGDLPLAVHIFAKQLQQSKILSRELFKLVEKEEVSLSNLSYENKDLYLAINISYKNLSKKAQAAFLSLGAFEGKDFSVEATAYMNGLNKEKARVILGELHNNSLIELSTYNKFRIHPMIKRFIAEKLANPKLLMLMKIVGFLFVLFTVYWIILQISTVSSSQAYFSRLFSAIYFVVALFGGIWGTYISQKWGGFKSTMGKGILFFALGLFAQSLGQILYLVYDILFHVPSPYPSLGDVGFFGTIPLYIYGVLFLAKASGIKMQSYGIKQNLKIFIVAVSVLIVGYLLLLQQYRVDWSNPMKIFLDFAYPLGEMIYVYLAFTTYIQARKAKTSIIIDKVFLIFIALLMEFLAEYVYIYQKNLQIWQFGNINEYMYFLAYLLMTLAILSLNSHMAKVITK